MYILKAIAKIISVLVVIYLLFIGFIVLIFSGEEEQIDYKVSQFISGHVHVIGQQWEHYEGFGYEVTLTYLPAFPPYGPFEIASFHYLNNNRNVKSKVNLNYNHQIYKKGNGWELSFTDGFETNKIFTSKDLHNWSEVEIRM